MSIITAIQLGQRSFPVNIIQGPLAGISCAPFRRLTWEYSKPAFTCTEMISCKTLIGENKYKERLIYKDPLEGPVCFQLSGSEPLELARATQLATEYGADLIDLNCGCPVNKIRAKGSGSSLLADAKLLEQLIATMRANTDIPLSIKIRVDGESHDHYNREVAMVVRNSGLNFITVHARHWTDSYQQGPYYDQINYFVDTLDIPVIGNGDVSCLDSLNKMLSTGCAGVMVSRAGVGQPWLIGQLIAQAHQQPFELPKAEVIAHLFVRHCKELSLLLNNETLAVVQSRKLAKYYGRQLNNKEEFLKAIYCCKNLDDIESVAILYFSYH
ncbi:MAG: tRNA dihydrouridine synthase [Legionella sp.]